MVATGSRENGRVLKRRQKSRYTNRIGEGKMASCKRRRWREWWRSGTLRLFSLDIRLPHPAGLSVALNRRIFGHTNDFCPRPLEPRYFTIYLTVFYFEFCSLYNSKYNELRKVLFFVVKSPLLCQFTSYFCVRKENAFNDANIGNDLQNTFKIVVIILHI